MSLFRSSLRPPAILSDEAVERYVTAIRADLTPDPLFRRRLRGTLVNRFVATREGAMPVDRSKHMGKLGRAVLYASFTLALSVSTAMAASQASLPGDPLYPLKRQIEALRLEALPSEYHDSLVAYAFGERMEELVGLADRGDWDAVERLAHEVETEHAGVLDAEISAAGQQERVLVVLRGLIERLPDRGQEAISDVLARVTRSDAGTSGMRDRASSPPGRGAMSREVRDGASLTPPVDPQTERREPASDGAPGRGATATRPPAAGSAEERPLPTPRPAKSPDPSPQGRVEGRRP